MDNLILTGYGWTEYAVAAAIALKGLDGLAEVAGVSKRRLPELLEATAKGVRYVCILGVALGGDEPRLAAALKAAKDMRPDQQIVVCLSGRGDKDIDHVNAWTAAHGGAPTA